jgi:hypothetical protein
MKRLVATPDAFETVLIRAFGEHPPLVAFENWTQCLSGQLHLVLEATLTSPSSYVQWLRVNLATRHLIPYVIHAAQRPRKRLEGITHVDALVVNADNGFTLLVEAKVLSDVSCMVSFDAFRNQIARTIDVMLERAGELGRILESRVSERSLLALLVTAPIPACMACCFMSTPRYRRPSAETFHTGQVWTGPTVARRLGWITFEDVARAIPGACPWLGATAT